MKNRKAGRRAQRHGTLYYKQGMNSIKPLYEALNRVYHERMNEYQSLSGRSGRSGPYGHMRHRATASEVAISVDATDEERLKNSVDAFLTYHQMNPERIDLNKCLYEYVAEMKKGLHDRAGKLLMLPTYIGMDRPVEKNRYVVAMDAGGTKLRTSLVKSDESGHLRIENFSSYEMPGAKNETDYIAFFGQLAQYIAPLAQKSRTICVSFAYPTETGPQLDGRIIRMSKEIRIKGIEGRMFGESLKEALHDGGMPDCHVLVTNDTVATALSGRAQVGGADSYMGLVLGTGINTSYTEKTKNIKKPGVTSDLKTMLINVESGNYAKQPRGDFDLAFDRTTKNLGEQTMEKMISGAYLGALIDHIIRASRPECLFSKAFYEAFEQVNCLDTSDLTMFLENDAGSALLRACAQNEDAAALEYLIRALIKRAAKLTALQVAGAAKKSGMGLSSKRPICVTAEGSTYERLPGMKQEVEATLGDWLEKEHGIYTKIIRVEHAVLKGAAVMGLITESA